MMHKYACKIAEYVREHYDPCKMKCSDLKELGAWTDILKDLTEYDKNMRIIEAMDEPDNDLYRNMSMDEFMTRAKMMYDNAPSEKKVLMKTEMMKIIQS